MTNPLWFETVSHKLCRLLAPWFMILLFLLSLAGTRGDDKPDTGMFHFLFVIQVAFYLSAAAGKRAGKIGGLARTFVVLNTAAMLGLWRHITGRQRVTW